MKQSKFTPTVTPLHSDTLTYGEVYLNT